MVIVLSNRVRPTSRYNSAKWRRVIRRDPCSYCGRRMVPLNHKIDNAALSDRHARRPTLDHIVPRVAGGPNSWMNLTGACHSCNAAKGSLDLLAFLLSRLPEYTPSHG